MARKRSKSASVWHENHEEAIDVAGDAMPAKRSITTLYDAVAGRATYEALLPQHDRTSKYRDTRSNTRQAYTPEDVLFRRKGAPTRYAENDIYFASERLEPNQKLPDSDLVKYLHAYASNFYKNATSTGGKRDWKSMDETALLALAILLEETVAHHLGTTGDLAFIAGEQDDEPGTRRRYWNGERCVQSVIKKRTVDSFKGAQAVD